MLSQLKFIIKQEILEPLREISYCVIFGSNRITPIYSVQGSITKLQFLSLMILFYCFYSIFEYFHNSLLTYIACLILFYAILTTVQKRCRNFGSSGTFWLLAVSLAFIGNMAVHFSNYHTVEDMLRKVYTYVLYFQILIFLILCIIPSKPKPDLTLRSPLLKYPLLYVVICWILAITSTFLVNHYAGITVF